MGDAIRESAQQLAATLDEQITPEGLYGFIYESSNAHGRRKAHAQLIYADMVTSYTINRYEQGEWRVVAECLAVLFAHGLIDIQYGPEKNVYDLGLTPMLQVANWSMIRPRRAAIPEKTRRAVYDRDGRECVTCGSEDQLSLDHIVPWSFGGSDDADNLRTLCVPCNSSRGNRVAHG